MNRRHFLKSPLLALCASPWLPEIARGKEAREEEEPKKPRPQFMMFFNERTRERCMMPLDQYDAHTIVRVRDMGYPPSDVATITMMAGMDPVCEGDILIPMCVCVEEDE